mgnify:CR=1 FL=1
MTKFNAVYKKSGKWYIGWVEEVPGVNTQGKTLAEVKANLREALNLVIQVNRELTRPSSGRVIRESLAV